MTEYAWELWSGWPAGACDLELDGQCDAADVAAAVLQLGQGSMPASEVAQAGTPESLPHAAARQTGGQLDGSTLSRLNTILGVIFDS
jgi:hypothetical protein